MLGHPTFLLLLLLSSAVFSSPQVLLVILARSRAHLLPTYLGFVEQLDYPKSDISVYIQTDHNQDDTPLLLSQWKDAAQSEYRDITLNTSSLLSYTQSLGPSSWEEDRLVHMMKIRQNALDFARAKPDIRYIFFVDTDNFIINPGTLRKLISRGKEVVAPMLTIDASTAYSNYWGGMTPRGYYKSVPEYFPILRREKPGIHKVPMVHSTLLIDLQSPNADQLRYFPMLESYTGPVDDIIHFATNAATAGVGMWVDNEEEYGLMLPRKEYNNVADEEMAFVEYLADVITIKTKVPRSVFLKDTRPASDKLGFDEIYMINLVRRPERRDRMIVMFDQLRIDARIFDAVDGKAMTQELLDSLNVKQLEGYQDPYLKRPLKFGEIGCFLSHFYIWEDMVAKNYDKVIVLEDDVRFKPNFRSELAAAMTDVKALQLDWDLIYLSRKILNSKMERWIPGSSRLVEPHYSYWTTGYMISNSGAKKLLAQNPTQKMMAVDEYLPLMFDAHPNKEWSAAFSPRNLRAFSVSPLLIEPQFYIGQDGYISDTETSVIIEEQVKDEL